MGKASRDKGARAEREVVAILKAYGFSTAQRTGEYVKNDILVHIDAHERIIEVKVRKNGCGAGLIYEALGDGIFAVAHKADRLQWLITMPLKTFCELSAPNKPYTRCPNCLEPYEQGEPILICRKCTESKREAA